MKEAWLIWDEDFTIEPRIVFDEPDVWYFKVKRIVFIEIIE